MENFNIYGGGHVRSGQYNNIRICGGGTGEGKITANKIQVNGSLSCIGDIESKVLEVNGQIRVENITARHVIINGSIECKNIICNFLEIYSRNVCLINKLEAGKVKIIRKKNVFLNYQNKISLNSVVAKNIEISGVNVKKILCENLTAKNSSIIEELNYYVDYYFDDSVVINKINKLE